MAVTTDQWGPRYSNVPDETATVFPWGSFPGCPTEPPVNSPFNQNVEETRPNPPSGGIADPVKVK